MRGRYARRELARAPSRAAGLVTIAVPRMADFRASIRSPGAYFLTGSPSAIPVLYWGSSARVLRDIRAAFSVSASDSYDQELSDALSSSWSDLRPAGVEVSSWETEGETWRNLWRAGDVLPLAAFRALVWRTYARERFPGGPVSVLFSREVALPRSGQSIGTLDASVSMNSGDVDCNKWPFNPFSGENPTGGEPLYNPWCTPQSGCDPYRVVGSSGKTGGLFGAGADAGAFLALFAVVALMGDSK